MASIQLHPPLLWAAGIVWPPVCIAVVSLRVISRRVQRVNLGVDDWLSVAALIPVLGMAATVLAAVAQKGAGYPTPKPPPGMELTASSPQQTVTRKAFMAVTLLSTVALCLIKLSCLYFYKRIFWYGSSRTVQWILAVLGLLVLIWGIGFFFAFLFACGTHFDYFWTTLENQLKCPADLTQISLSLPVSDFLMDVMLLVFPLPLIWKLKLSRARKFAVSSVFVLGALAIAMSITRLVIIADELNVEFAASADEDFVSTAGLYFTYIEACFALCAICLPSLSGMSKIQAVQNMVNGFGSMFSSSSSRTSSSSRPQAAPKVAGNSRGPSSEREDGLDPGASNYKLTQDIELNSLATESVHDIRTERAKVTGYA